MYFVQTAAAQNSGEAVKRHSVLHRYMGNTAMGAILGLHKSGCTP